MRTVLAAAAMMLLAGPAMASMVAYEGVPYDVGTAIQDTAKWRAIDDDGSDGWTVTSGSLSLTGFTPVPGDNKIERTLNSNAGSNASFDHGSYSSGNVYYGWLHRVTDLRGVAAAGDNYPYRLTKAVGTWGERFGLDPVSVLGDYEMYLPGPGSTALNLSLNTTYLMVLRMDLTNNQMYLYVGVDPTSTTEPGSANLSKAIGTTDNAYGFALIRWSQNPCVQIDSLRVGTTYASVVPEPATIGLLALGGLGMLLRRRR